MNIISVVIDWLHVGYLGCYGNSWIETQYFNQLAATGFLFDQALIESPDLAAQYACFTSLPGPAGLPKNSFVQRLRDAGMMSVLITDDPLVAELPWAAALDDVVHVDIERSGNCAAEIEETNLARLFAAVGEWLDEAREPFCLWLHCGSLGMSWDAPLAFRERYREEDDPAPLAGTTVPTRRLSEHYDPDELLPVTQAYAGQVSLLDICLGVLLEDMEQRSLADRTVLSLTSARGFPLGEHGRLGPNDQALYAELAHVPWILRFPDGSGAADRTQALVQPTDLAPTLVDALGLPLDAGRDVTGSALPLLHGRTEARRDRAFLSGPKAQRAVRTDAWYMRVPEYSAPGTAKQRDLTVELYAKPDDRWEVNDVADRCPEVVELLTAVLDAANSAETASAPAPLAEILTEHLD
ncbi:MAG TPA: sulfatase-like hydrolase/transferase [Pirellulales bacterium]|nr:sulfatase-like hydrolase/transferase [Pirellulales bacterium]